MNNTWLTVVLPIWVLAVAVIVGQWLYWRRKWRPSKPPHPDIVLAGRKLYEDGEFRREIVERIPRDLFSDEAKLSCGHKTSAMRNDSQTHVNCYQCAEEWIDREAKARIED
jgi:hypothetical protein